uniref:Uncharacterized protein n=1 Tax=Phenylobacterium glaciei TaxID=2803784 RepID=A0A974P2Q0_9CAUL|nr:hypothetical protein JKL49_19660 [Phenylobacterium glaciei]
MNVKPIGLGTLCALSVSAAAFGQDPAIPEAPAPLPMAAAPAPAELGYAPSLAWRVEQRFRLWDSVKTNPADADAAERLYTVLAETNDADVFHDDVVGFLKGRPNLHRKAHWDVQARRYDLSYIYPTTYTIRIGMKDPAPLAGRTCQWTTTVGVLDRAQAGCEFSVLLTLPARVCRSPPATVTAIVTVAGGELVSSRPPTQSRFAISSLSH